MIINCLSKIQILKYTYRYKTNAKYFVIFFRSLLISHIFSFDVLI